MNKDIILNKNKAVEQKRHWVRVTAACNNNCIFCLDSENQNGKNLKVDEIVLDLKEGIKLGAKRAILSGGDPTVYPKLSEIIKIAKKIGYEHVQIITNGRMLAYPKYAKKLKAAGLDEVTLSLHSHDEHDFEKITGVKGSYKQSLAGLVNAQNEGFIVSVDIVINKINIKKIKKTILFYINFGVSEFDLLYPIPFGKAWENKKEVFFSPDDSLKYLQEAFSLSKNNDLYIWTNRLPAQYLEGYEHLIQDPVKIFDEITGRKRALINFIKNGIPMQCHGERCQYCSMNGFCKDLKILLSKKELVSIDSPRCLNKNKKDLKLFKFDDSFDLESFADFYINNRYFVKSLRCSSCKYFYSCDGTWIRDVINNGFNILKPIK